MNAAQSLQQYTSTKAFRLGLGIVGAVYVILFAFLWYNGDDTIKQMNDRLATQTVLIERAVTVSPTPVAEKAPIVSPTETATTEHENAPAAPDAIPAITASAALAKAPIDGLSEDTQDGRMPKIRDADKLSPFEAYRRPSAPLKTGMPSISIGVMDFGLSDDASKQALSDLSPDVSMVMTPYTKAADYWLGEARNNGHEVWMELPVETEGYPRDDSGPQTLLVGAIERQNLKKLSWIMSQAQGYVGLVTPYQPAFMRSEIDVKPVMDTIFTRGLGFIDGETTAANLARKIAVRDNSPYDNADVWIDIPATPEHMAASLRQLEVMAQGSGSSIGFIYSTPTGLKALQTWIDGLPQKGIAIIPLSAQAKKTK